MKDRIVQFPKRYKITRSDGSTEMVTIDAEPGIITEAGTPINKANLFSDETAAMYELAGNDATVNNALRRQSLSSYMAFCGNVNADSLDAAFGKNNEDKELGVGRALAMYAWFKGLSKSDETLLMMCNFNNFSDICENYTLKRYIYTTETMYNLIKASPYAFEKFKNTATGLPDIVLYEQGASNFINLPGTNTGLTEFDAGGTRLEMVKRVDNSPDLSSGTATFSIKNPLTNYPFSGYRYLKMLYSDSPTSQISGGFSGASMDFKLGNVDIPFTLVGSGEGVKDNFDFFATQLAGASGNMTFTLATSAYDSSSTYITRAYIEKIWITEV